MKKGLLSAFIALSGFTSQVSAQTLQSPWTGNQPSNGTFYLYNVVTGKWIETNNWNNNDWATHGELGNIGIDFKFGFNSSNNSYAINPQFGGGHCLRGDFYLDTGDTYNWRLTPVSSDNAQNVYSIVSDNSLIGVENGALSNGTGGSDNNQWQLVTREERVAALANANANMPMDATFLVHCNEFSRNDERFTNWKEEGIAANKRTQGAGWDEGRVKCNSVYEAWELTNGKVYQDVQCPNGTYIVSMQGVYSPTANDGVGEGPLNDYLTNGEATINAYFFAGNQNTKLPSFCTFKNEVQKISVEK